MTKTSIADTRDQEGQLAIVSNVMQRWPATYKRRALRPEYDARMRSLQWYFAKRWRSPRNADRMAFACARVLDEWGYHIGDDERLSRALDAWVSDAVRPLSPEARTILEIEAEWGGRALAVILANLRLCRDATIARRKSVWR
jgi:hypothetical protein